MVSHATRASASWARMASRMESEIWSAILSGCPSVTDSEVNVHLLMVISFVSLGVARRPNGRSRRRTAAGHRPLVGERHMMLVATVGTRSRPRWSRAQSRRPRRPRRWPPAGRRPWPPAWPRRWGDVRRLRREAHHGLARRLGAAQLRQDVHGGRSSTAGTPSAFFSLCGATVTGVKSATAAAMTTTSAPAARSMTASCISGRGLHATRSTPAGTGSEVVVTNVTRAPRPWASSARAWPCLPEDRLPRNRTGSRGSRVPPAVTSTCRPSRSPGCGPDRRAPGSVEDGLGRGDDGGRVGQPAGTDVATGQAPCLRVHHVDATGPQQGQVVLHGRVLPHLGVHGGTDHHGGPGGDQDVGEQVV